MTVVGGNVKISRKVLIVAVFLVALWTPIEVLAATHTFTLTGDDLASAYLYTGGDPGLSHDAYYMWGLTQNFEGQIIDSAKLTFSNLNNWITEPNWMAVYLLNSPQSGITVIYDYQKDPNVSSFTNLTPESDYAYLDTLTNVPAIGQDFTLDFASLNGDRIGVLRAFAEDNMLGIGFDPHCHYYFDSITLEVTTKAVPEPSTIIMLGTGLVIMASWGRKKYRN